MKDKLKRSLPFILGGLGLVVLLVLLRRQQATTAEGSERARASSLLGYLAGSFQQVTSASGSQGLAVPPAGGTPVNPGGPEPVNLGPLIPPPPVNLGPLIPPPDSGPVNLGPYLPAEVGSVIGSVDDYLGPGTNPPPVNLGPLIPQASVSLLGAQPVPGSTGAYVQPVSSYVVRLASGAEVNR